MTFDPDWVVAPGDTLAEWFVENFDLDAETLISLLIGRQVIDDELAEKLSTLTGVSAQFWMALDHIYRDGLAAGKTRVT